MAHDLSISTSDFDTKVTESELPVVVDFWAPWCGPCRNIAPHVELLANEYAGKVNIFKLDVEEDGEIASKLGIMGIPAFLAFKGGEVVDTLVGANEKQLRELIEKLV